MQKHQENSIIFLHLPKTAGTTLVKIIQRQYKEGVFSINGANMQALDEFKDLPITQRENIKILITHRGFGLHQYLSPSSQYITIMRDPVDRIISHYYFVLRQPEHYLYNTVTSHNMSLKDYVRSGISTELDNGQTRLLAGIDHTVPFRQCSTETLETAKENLQKYFVAVGLTERFDETLLLLKRTLGWKNIFYIKENVNESRPGIKDVNEDTIKVIEKHNELDIQLYQYVTQKFNETLKSQDGQFERELELFKLLNRKPYVNTLLFLQLLTEKISRKMNMQLKTSKQTQIK